MSFKLQMQGKYFPENARKIKKKKKTTPNPTSILYPQSPFFGYVSQNL
jgi:hypothetical protein